MTDSQEPEHELGALQRQVESLTTNTEILVDRLSQSLMAIHVSSETLMLELDQGGSIPSQELHVTLSLIRDQSQIAIDRLRDARRRLGWDSEQLGEAD